MIIMNRIDILEKLNIIFRDVMDNEDIVLEETICAENVEEWDSLAHIQLIEKIQENFGVKFSAKEMRSWEDVGELVDSIEEKLSWLYDIS